MCAVGCANISLSAGRRAAGTLGAGRWQQSGVDSGTALSNSQPSVSDADDGGARMEGVPELAANLKWSRSEIERLYEMRGALPFTM